MAALTQKLDLARLQLGAGEGRRLALHVEIEPLSLGSESYAAEPGEVAVTLDVSRMLGGGYALRLRFAAALAAPVKVLCRSDCAGLCPICAADLNEAGAGHRHERAPDARWAKLRELRLE